VLSIRNTVRSNSREQHGNYTFILRTIARQKLKSTNSANFSQTFNVDHIMLQLINTRRQTMSRAIS